MRGLFDETPTSNLASLVSVIIPYFSPGTDPLSDFTHLQPLRGSFNV